MKANVTLVFLLALSVFTQQLFFSFPLSFLVTYIILARNPKLFLLVIAGILSFFADAILSQPLGATLALASFFNLGVFVYARFLGSRDTLVYTLFGLIGTFIYAIIFGYSVPSLLSWYIIFLAVWIVYKLIPARYLFL